MKITDHEQFSWPSHRTVTEVTIAITNTAWDAELVSIGNDAACGRVGAGEIRLKTGGEKATSPNKVSGKQAINSFC